MSEYSPIDDHSHANAAPYKAEHISRQGGGSYSSSHPYSSAYGSRGDQPESQAIQVTPPASTTTATAGGYSLGAGYRTYGGGEPTAGPSTFGSQDGGQRISRYETSLSLRYDIEASLAYAFGVFSEKKNDYVRFHAWQSSLLSATLIIALIVSALVSNSIYYFVVLTVVASHVYMVRRAYFDGAVFERFELPYIGPLASQLVDEE
ncbi:hypothetical protein GGI20_000156 [Coemansia sp. BCRC 34301]|nr:hypothetical protein GGI20_000156 [Coemansia sp. BCRC 34301]